MTAYNTAPTIEKAIKSVFDQTYKNIELVIVDDNSTDSTAEIVGECVGKKKNVRFVRTPKNVGCGGARNYGLKFASGELVCFLDSDDFYDDTFVEMMVREIGGADMCHCPLLFCSPNGEHREHSSVEVKTLVHGLERLTGLENHWLTSFNCGVYKKSLLDRVTYSTMRCLDDRHTGVKLQILAEQHVLLPADCGVKYNYIIRDDSVFQTLGKNVSVYEAVLWLEIDKWSKTKAAEIEGGKHAVVTTYVTRILNKFLMEYRTQKAKYDEIIDKDYPNLMYDVACFLAETLTNVEKSKQSNE